jgi:hypothetical protein
MLTIKWIDRGFEPKNPPDPRYPNGIDLDLSEGASATCLTALPYPAKRCGYFLIACDECDFSGIITTAGRRDDPRSAKIACKVNRKGNGTDR